MLGENLISIFESLFCFGNELYMKVEALTEIAEMYLSSQGPISYL